MQENERIDDVLKPAINGLTLIITIGNSYRMDDGVGPFIADNVKSSEKIKIINAFDRPENVIEEALNLKPVKTIIIDAADFNGKSGEINIIKNECISDETITTHTFPPKIIAELLKKETGCEVFFIGIQPQKRGFGEGLSDKVKKSADKIIKQIKKNIEK